jgi:uncharacterized protein with von Willebrand factor type A (vWA) domain
MEAQREQLVAELERQRQLRIETLENEIRELTRLREEVFNKQNEDALAQLMKPSDAPTDRPSNNRK